MAFITAVNLQQQDRILEILLDRRAETTPASAPGGQGTTPALAPGGQDDASLLFPYVWLRDNCLCSVCFQSVSCYKGRLLMMRDLDVNVTPVDAKVSPDGSQLTVTWSDGHHSCYGYHWLWERRFVESVRQRNIKATHLPMELWGCELQNNISTDKFDNLLTKDASLHRWLCAMEKTGLFLIEGAPCETGQVAKLANRVAFLRKTCYGETFTVKAKPESINVAYTNKTLTLHTDLPAYYSIPAIQMLHCIVQTSTEGGDNEFSDGFHVSDQLRQKDPEAFRILTDTPVDFRNEGDDLYSFFKSSRKPTICFDYKGDFDIINFNNSPRDSFLNIPVNEVGPFYNALKKFDTLLHDQKNKIRLKMKPGDIVCFHNTRVLHGRTAYSMMGGERHLEGGYMDWDEMRSRRRVLERSDVA